MQGGRKRGVLFYIYRNNSPAGCLESTVTAGTALRAVYSVDCGKCYDFLAKG